MYFLFFFFQSNCNLFVDPQSISPTDKIKFNFKDEVPSAEKLPELGSIMAKQSLPPTGKRRLPSAESNDLLNINQPRFGGTTGNSSRMGVFAE